MTNPLEPFYAGTPADEWGKIARNPVYGVLDNLRSAFNVGSIFRTADAGAVERLLLCGATAYPPNAKLAKTALGAFDYVPWTYYRETAEAIDFLRERGVTCVAVETVAHAVSHVNFAWPRPVGIVFGNEVHGIRPDILARCEATVFIPMGGFKNTINVATAFGVVLYEILRQWGATERMEKPETHGGGLP